jgi:hypothetical protein
MTAENRSNQELFETSLDTISGRGAATLAAVNEFKKGLRDGDIKVIVRPSVQIWKVGGEIQPSGKAYVFLPEGITSEQIASQAIDIMLEAFIRTRRLSGPQLTQLEDFGNSLREEALRSGVRASDELR